MGVLGMIDFESMAEVINKNNKIFTKFTFKINTTNYDIEKKVIDLGGNLIKETKNNKQYLLEGNNLYLILD